MSAVAAHSRTPASPALARIGDLALGHPRLAALALGLASATGFEPLHLWPLALLAMGGFALILGRAGNWKRALLLGWLFGWAHFTLGNNWIATAFTHQAAMPAVLGWAAVPLLAIYLAVYPALAALGGWLIAGRNPRILAVAFAGAWIVTEWLRSWVFTGYVWNPFAMVLLGPLDRPGIAALAPWLGTYALSGLAVLIACGLAVLLAERRWVAAAVASVLILVATYMPVGQGREGTLQLTLVQPNFEQDRINNPRWYEANYERLAELSLPGREGPRLVLWPESGLADILQDGYPQRYYDMSNPLGSPAYSRGRIARTIGRDSLVLTGTLGLAIEDGRAAGAYNNAIAIDGQAEIRGLYAKAHLVPYGEYLPMRWLLEPLGLSRLVPGAIDFWPGPGPQTLDLGEFGQASVQICYEIIFSGQVADRAARPDYIFNPSNEAWFATSAQPQFLAQARMRAIEEGLPVLRSTTTGISAVIDARGVVREHVPTHGQARIDTLVPPAHAPTLFARTGNVLPLCWAVLLLVVAVIATRRRRR